MNALTTLLLSALHNATAAAAATIVPAVVTLVNVGPTGNALVYAQAHPAVLAAYAIAALVFRDLLKNVPMFGAVAATGAPQSAAKT